jgi:hypothetical protein
LQVTAREKELILFMRELMWGDLKVRVENGEPVLIYEAIRTFKLGENKAQELLRKSGGPRREPAGSAGYGPLIK